MLKRFLEYFVFPWVMPFYGGGKGGGGGSSINEEVAALAQQGTFKPFTITTSGGTAFGREGEFGAAASPEFQQAQQTALAGVNQLLPSVAGAFGREATPFSYGQDVTDLQRVAYQKALSSEFGGLSNADINALQSAATQSALAPTAQFQATPFDVVGRTSDIYQQQSELLAPAFEQQQQALKNNLFGSGRLGLSLAGSAVGAGEGMVNPDAFGLASAQSGALANLATQSRQQALSEQAQQYGQGLSTYQAQQAAEQARQANLAGLGSQLFGQQLQGFGAQQQQYQNLAGLGGTLGQQQATAYGLNDAAQQQYAQNLLAGATGLFGIGSGVTEQELAILSGGLTGEQLRSSSYIDAAAALSKGMEQQQSGGGKGLLGTVAGAAAGSFTGGLGEAAGKKWFATAAKSGTSDARLKTNIQYDSTDANGIHWYTWDWNTTAKELGLAHDRTYGVIAQEVMEIIPEAVVMYPDGYYRVNYELIEKVA